MKHPKGDCTSDMWFSGTSGDVVKETCLRRNISVEVVRMNES